MAKAKIDTTSSQQAQIKAEAKKILAKRKKARESFLEFILYCNKRFVVTPYHEVICAQCQWWVETPNASLILEGPPQTGKSEIVSRYLPAWILGIDPDGLITGVSYAAERANANSLDVQRIMDTAEYLELFPETNLQKVGNGFKGKWKRTESVFEVIEKRGKYRAAGIQGAITGFPIKYGIVDDPISGPEDAMSETIKQKTWDWWVSTFTTRATDDARTLVMATRWALDDLTGRIKAQALPGEWRIVSFPFIALPKEEQGPYEFRQPGEILPTHKKYTELEILRIQRDPYWFSAMYQQNPVAREGNVIQKPWFRLVHSLPKKFVSCALYFDIGGSNAKTADSTVGTVVGREEDGKATVVFQEGFQENPNERNEKILSIARDFHEIFPEMTIYLEAGIGLGVQSVNEIRDYLLSHEIPVQIDHVRDSKVKRLTNRNDSFLLAAGSSRIDFYTGYNHNDWINKFFEESLQLRWINSGFNFVGPHDDRLDSMFGAYNKSSRKNFTIQLIEEIIQLKEKKEPTLQDLFFGDGAFNHLFDNQIIRL